MMRDPDGKGPRRPPWARWRPRRGNDVSVAAAARAWVVGVLPRLLNRPAAAALRDNVELLVTELTANALMHAGGVEHIDVSCTGTMLRIAVHDRDASAVAARRAAGPDAENGRGLLLVDALAARWGVEKHPGDGKDVWLELALDR
jgi:hypothetical protein